MEEEKCDSCDTPLTEENKCSCEPSKCKGCCTCPEDCDCGCKKADGGEEKEESAETAETPTDPAAEEGVADGDAEDAGADEDEAETAEDATDKPETADETETKDAE